MNNNFEYLVCSGGGIGLCTYAGAFKELAKRLDISKLKGVAGTSAGAIAALGLSLKLSPSLLEKKLMGQDFKKITNISFFKKLANLFFHYGMYDGDYILDSACDLLREKIKIEVQNGRLPPNDPLVTKNPVEINFIDLKRLGCLNLAVQATKLYKINDKPVSKEKVFSFETTPLTSVATAIRASCAATPVIMPIRLKKLHLQTKDGQKVRGTYIQDKLGDLFVDGGLRDNCPTHIFDKQRYVDATQPNSNNKATNYKSLILNLDFCETNQSENRFKTPIYDGCIRDFISASTHAFWKGYVLKQRKSDEIRKVNIYIGDFNSFDFSITDADKKKLVDIGEAAVKAHFDKLEQTEKVAIESETTNNLSLRAI